MRLKKSERICRKKVVYTITFKKCHIFSYNSSLVCEVNYTTPAGLPQYFRKFFKFQVLKPLDVKTKFYNAEMDEIYLEAQIQNITTGPFCLEKVELDSSDQYTVTSLNTLPNGESVFTSKNMLQPNNSCQFLYCIKVNKY